MAQKVKLPRDKKGHTVVNIEMSRETDAKLKKIAKRAKMSLGAVVSEILACETEILLFKNKRIAKLHRKLNLHASTL